MKQNTYVLVHEFCHFCIRGAQDSCQNIPFGAIFVKRDPHGPQFCKKAISFGGERWARQKAMFLIINLGLVAIYTQPLGDRYPGPPPAFQFQVMRAGTESAKMTTLFPIVYFGYMTASSGRCNEVPNYVSKSIEKTAKKNPIFFLMKRCSNALSRSLFNFGASKKI